MRWDALGIKRLGCMLGKLKGCCLDISIFQSKSYFEWKFDFKFVKSTYFVYGDSRRGGVRKK